MHTENRSLLVPTKHFSRRLTHVPEAVIATTKGVLSLASVERDPRLAIEELELAVDHREDFALSKVTMRRGPRLGPRFASQSQIHNSSRYSTQGSRLARQIR